MSRIMGILTVLAVVLLAMGFAAANAGHRVAIDLGLFTLYRVPVTMVAFSGLLVGMVVMFATGVYTDLKVRRILRERLADETRGEQRWIDGNQQDLFAGMGNEESPESEEAPELPTSIEPEPIPELPGTMQPEPNQEPPVAMESEPTPGFPAGLDSEPTPEYPVEEDELEDELKE